MLFKRFAVIFSTLLLTGLSGGQISSQGGLQIKCGTTYDSTTQMPDPFPGAYYGGIYGSRNPDFIYRFDRITQYGQTIIEGPFDAAESAVLAQPLISPDGQRMAFRPSRQGSEIKVWDMHTGEVARLEVSQEEIDYLSDRQSRLIDGLFFYLRKLVWKNSDTLLIQYFGIYSHELKAQKEIAILNNPLRFVPGLLEDMNYLTFLSSDKDFETHQFSPLRTYTSLMTLDSLRGVGLSGHLTIYNTTSGALIFDLSSTAEQQVDRTYHPVWMATEQTFFQAVRTENLGTHLMQFDLNTTFEENHYLMEVLEEAFGSLFSISNNYPPSLSNDGSRLAFQIGTSVNNEYQDYIVIYQPFTGEITAICDNSEPAAYTPIWSYADLYFGHYYNNTLRLFDPRNGDMYLFPSTGYSGWINDYDEPVNSNDIK